MQKDTLIGSALNYNLPEIVNKGLAYAIIVAGILSVVFIVWGGFKFILSGGDEAKIKGAVGTIRYSIIGLFITVMAVIFVSIAGRFIGLDVVQYLNMQDILENVQSITASFSSKRSTTSASLE